MAKIHHPIRFGIQTGQQNTTWEDLRGVWEIADDIGLDSAWVFDHFMPIFADPTGPCLEGWTLLAALAQRTRRIRLGVLVTGNTYRHPAVLAKMATTLDILSGGRLNLGLGAGWFEAEHRAYDIRLPKLRERLDMLEEALEVIRQLWTHEVANYQGKYYQLRDAPFYPKPIQQPHPPIMIGAGGERIALGIVARHADLWNTFGSPEVLRRKIRALDEHCRTAERNPAAIEKSVLLSLFLADDPAAAATALDAHATRYETDPSALRRQSLVGDAEAVQDQIRAYIEAGVTHFILMLRAPYDLRQLRHFAERVVVAVHG